MTNTNHHLGCKCGPCSDARREAALVAAKEEAEARRSAAALFARAKVDADPMGFAVRGAIFRGYYVFTHGNLYLTKDGKWTHGCTAPDDGNWWDTRGEAQSALENFRLANVSAHAPCANERRAKCSPSSEPPTTTQIMTLADLKKHVDAAIENAIERNDDPSSIPVTLQLDRADDDPLWSDAGVELHYDGGAQATGCVIVAFLPENDQGMGRRGAAPTLSDG